MRTLVLRFSALGDIILTTPVLAALKAHDPGGQLLMAVKTPYVELFRSIPWVDQILPFDNRGVHRGLRGLVRFVKTDQPGFDLLLDLHANLRSHLIGRLIPAKKRVRYNKQRLSRMTILYGLTGHGQARHTVDRYLAALNQVGIVTVSRQPQLHPSFQDRQSVLTKLSAFGIPAEGQTVALCPGASSPVKQWPESYFAHLGRRLRQKYRVSILVVGGPDETGLCQRIAGAIGQGAISLADLVTLGELPAVLKRCALIISNDSGLMHAAVAVARPVVALFGPTHPALGFWPLGRDDVVIHRGLACSPCSLHGDKGCPLKTRPCLTTLSATEVFGVVEPVLTKVLAEKPPSFKRFWPGQ